MDDTIVKQLELIARDGVDVVSIPGANRWAARVLGFIQKSIGAEAGREFDSLQAPNWDETHGLRLGHVEGLLALAQASATAKGDVPVVVEI